MSVSDGPSWNLNCGDLLSVGRGGTILLILHKSIKNVKPLVSQKHHRRGDHLKFLSRKRSSCTVGGSHRRSEAEEEVEIIPERKFQGIFS